MIQELKTFDDYNTVINSSEKTFVFKHSTQCPISSMAHRNVESFGDSKEVTFHQVYVIENRSLSNAIEDTTGILHESPQLLVFQNGKVVSHTSHRNINESYLSEHIG